MILTQDQVKSILARAKEGLEKIYGDRLKGVYLYGSYARGTPYEFSDVDIAIILDRVDELGGELFRTSSLFADLTIDSGIHVSRAFIAEEDFEHGHYALCRNIKKEGLAA
jgi:predicted nucleotidyltransferase